MIIQAAQRQTPDRIYLILKLARYTDVMDTPAPDTASLPDDFRASAAPADRRETVTLTLDADVVAWMRAEFPDWQGQVNGLLRFFHDTSLNREASFDPDGFEPGEMVANAPPEPEFA
ncbi:BrnA antitoxin family protein [Lichenifustis flavocetrariae]|uniref:BrnA antitoxin family protein n=1 Tax=Lichenifustis flavocetrariae TaxID=2949735 RepID=A0AA41Z8J7_9HYPH|nr:BrnA antitoxin family protein [Lichenifustis flavocetrariae]MCW6512295.1 BrnA antitoxin family protein [Lichenifustis flavocetrariae]